MTLKAVAICCVAMLAAACTPSGRSAGGSSAPVDVPPVPGALGNVEEARAIASGNSFLRPSGSDSYEVLYFDPGGKVSLLRAEQVQIAHGRWVAEMAPVGSSPTPVPALCITLNANRRCLDPQLLASATEKAKGDILGIGRWDSVPESLPRERASLEDIRTRLRS